MVHKIMDRWKNLSVRTVCLKKLGYLNELYSLQWNDLALEIMVQSPDTRSLDVGQIMNYFW